MIAFADFAQTWRKKLPERSFMQVTTSTSQVRGLLFTVAFAVVSVVVVVGMRSHVQLRGNSRIAADIEPLLLLVAKTSQLHYAAVQADTQSAWLTHWLNSTEPAQSQSRICTLPLLLEAVKHVFSTSLFISLAT